MNNLGLIKNLLETEKKDLEEKLKNAQKSCREAPTATESRSDISRAYYENLIVVLHTKIIEMEKLISQLPKELPKTRNLWQKFDKYILVPEGYGGRKIGDTFLVSVNSPLGQKLNIDQ